MNSFFTDKQWRWVKERYDEGYTMDALSKFLGINRRSIRVALIRQGFYPALKSHLPPLEERKKEFLALRMEDGKATWKKSYCVHKRN